MIPVFYSSQPRWAEQIEEIIELLSRIRATEELVERAPELRRANRIAAVQSTTAIEGNSLTLGQSTAVAEGRGVFAPPREVLEIENALTAYDTLKQLDPWNVDDFLYGHRLLTQGLIGESGQFRTVDVDIVNLHGDVIHSGSRSGKVPRLVTELLQWGSQSRDHPLVVSSAVHFLIEHIHPFRDGNGRIGRLWQTLILSDWRDSFAWLPTETLIKRNQSGYYQALQASREPEIDAAPFVDFMLDVILQALREYENGLRSDASVGINVGIKQQMVALLLDDPSLTAERMANILGRTPRTIERHLATLTKEGVISREGSKKTGRWIVTMGDSDE